MCGIQRTQRLVILLPLTVHPEDARRERDNESVLKYMAHEARFSASSRARNLYSTWVHESKVQLLFLSHCFNKHTRVTQVRKSQEELKRHVMI